jgi:hypothetical protein
MIYATLNAFIDDLLIDELMFLMKRHSNAPQSTLEPFKDSSDTSQRYFIDT